MRILEGLEPERVFYYFEEICSIPHGSGNTKKISDYCVNFAKKNNLDFIQDEYNNVIIKKNASKGYDNHPPVIIQGHLDMVCEKEEGLDFDFETDGINVAVNNDVVYAKGTTLGGDDGIAIAMALAILEDKDTTHPPIEAVFTTDEETGMDGAIGLDTSVLSAKTLINIDSENEGILTVSCAGGARADIAIPLTTQTVNGKCYKVVLDGLIGGHSGVEIDKGRLNSNILMGKFLSSLNFDYNIYDIHGGLKDNAIPRYTECIIITNGDIKNAANDFVDKNTVDTDPDLKITVTDYKSPETAFDTRSSKNIAKYLSEVINGIVSMSQDIEGLVQTSLNLGIMICKDNSLYTSFAVRSSVNDEKLQLLTKLEKTAESFGAKFSTNSHYPAWEFKKDSYLRDTMVKVYKEMYGKSPIIEAIHAGLECGLFCDKIDGLDAVSFGPNMESIHTTEEKLYIESVERTYNYLCQVLKTL